MNVATKSAKEELAKLHAQIKEGSQVFLAQRAEQEQYYSKVDAEIQDLEHTKKVLQETNATLSHENIDLQSAIIVHSSEIERLRVEEAALQSRTAELKESIEHITAELSELQDTIVLRSTQLDEVEQEFASTKADMQRQVSILEARLDALREEIMDNNSKQEHTRDALAEWEKKVGERDKNVRIREEKVSGREKALIRNYELLNL